MPLHPGTSREVFSENVSEMVHAHHPLDQALAAAYRMKRQGRAPGGGVAPAPWFVRSEARGMAGPLRSAVPGRTDHLPITVGGGSYILPADHISALGQNNTHAGMAVVNHMFGPGGPYGSGPTMPIGRGRLPSAPRIGKGRKADGGGVGSDPVDIMAAGGEYVLSPEQVAAVGGGDIDRGHAILDKWVLETRKKHVKSLRSLPPPAKD